MALQAYLICGSIPGRGNCLSSKCKWQFASLTNYRFGSADLAKDRNEAAFDPRSGNLAQTYAMGAPAASSVASASALAWRAIWLAGSCAAALETRLAPLSSAIPIKFEGSV